MRDTSKQAFPAMDMNHREGIPSMELRYEGMTLLEYYVAHAPIEPQGWFEPTMVTECPKVPTTQEGTLLIPKTGAEYDKIIKDQNLWWVEYNHQTKRQWPLAWAKEMIKQLKHE